MTVLDILLNGIHHINLVKIKYLNSFFKVKKKVQKNTVKMEWAK